MNVGKSGSQQGPILNVTETNGTVTESIQQQQLQSNMEYLTPLWQLNSTLDLKVYVDDKPAASADLFSEVTPVIDDKGITIGGDYDRVVYFDYPIDGDDFVQSNKSLYAHLVLTEAGVEWNIGDDAKKGYVTTRPLTTYVGPPKKVIKKHLLGNNAEDKDIITETEQDRETTEEEDEETIELGQPVPYYHPNVTIGLVQILQSMKLDENALAWFKHFGKLSEDDTPKVDAEGNALNETFIRPTLYYPGVYLNRFWQLHSQHLRVNSTTTSIPLSLEIHTMGPYKFQLYNGMEEAKKQQGASMAEMDKMKEILLDSNPYLLGITVLVSIFHSLFEFLAFKNDISHWNKKKDTIGVSVRSIIANVVMQTIIFLYLLDNTEQTSYMILFSQISGIAVEAWKVTKIVDIKIENGRLVFKDKHELSEVEQKTKEYDEEIFKYMYIGSVPLILAYAWYALVYLTHKSWYSFIISTLVGSVYAYGFLMLVPSIYINYKLKSVAHMPRRAMVYKFLNTFIDDLFAFVIKMPLLHRLATLRDDVIFFIYLYQTWLYKVDYSRVNEFGQGGEEEDEVNGPDGKKTVVSKVDEKGETKKVK